MINDLICMKPLSKTEIIFSQLKKKIVSSIRFP